ncbi:hemin uptake protein HemP [Massilia sp. MB5]|uniref:hemin uptake protein HemP n=1 Tax=Massilia sp. MB5 TaxID=2919578 RepID=UPI001F0CEE9E|nr:hemin uptake protein HemP [Massilia sp. MB5]UMR30607.1 hemin uptake protein HemP [Massilia sp. MB5]
MHTSPLPAIRPTVAAPAAAQPVRRLTTAGLMQDQREVEIEHAGRIYRLRITQLNKLILTA